MNKDEHLCEHTEARACIDMAPTALSIYPSAVAEGINLPYDTFVPTFAATSTLPGAGTGLYTVHALEPFQWVGFYPGKVSSRVNRKLASHTMGTVNDLYIIADPTVKTGVHMVNEPAAGCGADANVFYVKMPSNGLVLYFAGRAIGAGEELLTCYSRAYMKRPYAVPRSCADPRCNSAGGKHRCTSGLDEAPEGWRESLERKKPKELPVDPFA